MSYHVEWMVDLVSTMENTNDPKRIHHVLRTTLEDESISLLEIYKVLKKRAYGVKIDNKLNLQSMFGDPKKFI
jgi:hypothetical protein